MAVDKDRQKALDLTVSAIEEELSEYQSLWQDPRMIAGLFVLAASMWIIRKLNNMP